VIVELPRLKRYDKLPGHPVSVTSVLGAVWPKPGLQRWFEARAVELGREHPHLPVAKVLAMRAADKSAADRGSRVHRAIDAYISNKPELIPPLRSVEAQMWEQWKAFWISRMMHPLATEMTVAAHGYAGTLDLLALDSYGLSDDQMGPPPRVVVDWKTTRNLPEEPYPDHAAQLAAYAEAYYVERGSKEAGFHPMGTIDYGVVVYIAPDGVKAFTLSDTEWNQAKHRWRAAWHFFLELWPEFDQGKVE
jgi:hypothetical protein